MSRYTQQIGWDDVPHLSEDQKDLLWEAIPPHQRDARTKGVPILGAGQIYPVDESVFLVDPFDMPHYWPRAYGLDADWNRTAACWGAWNRDDDTVYVYSEHFGGQEPPSVHADAIRRRGDWIIGAMDPSTNGKISPKDGTVLAQEYRDLGINLMPADNAVEAGIFACYQRLAAGRLKIFKTCRRLISEIRIYRRDEHGKVVKVMDDMMDAMRYLIMTGLVNAQISPSAQDDEEERGQHYGRSPVTGY